jgi:hypothetical protein
MYMGAVGAVMKMLASKEEGGAAPAAAAKPAAAKPAAAKPSQDCTLCPVPLFHATGSHAIFLCRLEQ